MSEFDLAMPFVNVTSRGGKFDDDAYVAGFEMGCFEARCKLAVPFEAFPIHATIHRDNLDQADLIAMRHGLTLSEKELDPDIYDADTFAGWAIVTVSPPMGETLEGPPDEAG